MLLCTNDKKRYQSLYSDTVYHQSPLSMFTFTIVCLYSSQHVKKVLWSDEIKFELNIKHIWWKPNTVHHPENPIPMTLNEA